MEILFKYYQILNGQPYVCSSKKHIQKLLQDRISIKKIKALAGGNLSNIKTFTKSETAPNINSMTSANIISTDDSNSPIYAWYDNGTIFWWSEAEKVYMNVDCNNMFYGCSSLTTLSLENFDTSKVTNMSYMFYKCNNITALNLTGFTKYLQRDMFSTATQKHH